MTTLSKQHRDLILRAFGWKPCDLRDLVSPRVIIDAPAFCPSHLAFDTKRPWFLRLFLSKNGAKDPFTVMHEAAHALSLMHLGTGFVMQAIKHPEMRLIFEALALLPHVRLMWTGGGPAARRWFDKYEAAWCSQFPDSLWTPGDLASECLEARGWGLPRMTWAKSAFVLIRDTLLEPTRWEEGSYAD